MANPALTDNTVRYGSNEPLPERHVLHAGPVSVVLENGDLRYVRLGDVEIVRRLYVAIRDRNWDTIPPNYTTYRVDDQGDPTGHRRNSSRGRKAAGSGEDQLPQRRRHGHGEGNPPVRGTGEYGLGGGLQSRSQNDSDGKCCRYRSALGGGDGEGNLQVQGARRPNPSSRL